MDIVKTSLLVPSQLPEFIRDDENYSNFELFLKSYYEWMEQANNVLGYSKNLLSYQDIDESSNTFLNYYVGDFLQYFPKDSLISQETALKAGRELYQSKGTPAAYQFLFKVLFDSEFDIFYTKEAVLKASAGNWYVAKSLKLSTNDYRFLNINNYRIFGESSKSIATIESSVIVGNKIEVFISNIERLFESGEFVRVLDNRNQDVTIDGQLLRAKIVGQVSQVNIDPKNRGLQYVVGDPVIVYGGLNDANGVGAIARVKETTTGSIERINVISGGFGYRLNPNTKINITPTNGAAAHVFSYDPDPKNTANVNFACNNSITFSRYTTIGNTVYSFFDLKPGANANTRLVDALTFESFITYPISSVRLDNGGGGFAQTPQITATSIYKTNNDADIDISSLGILGPIQIINPGLGYVANDKIRFSGGYGYGAYGNVKTVSANGQILSVEYIQSTDGIYPLGGMGYKLSSLPTLNVESSNVLASNASLVVTSILGDGAVMVPIVNRVGSISTIELVENGEDYSSTPNVSLKVQDIVVSNVFISNLPKKDDIIYQGDSLSLSTYQATVNSISLLTPYSDPQQSLYNLRVFNYNTNPDTNKELKIDSRGIGLVMANTKYSSDYNTFGVRNYGDGSAKATASFLNGLVIGQGTYLSKRGHLSSFNVLQDENYNNYTYQITVKKEIAKYREVLLNLLHPAGTKVIGRYSSKSNSSFNLESSTSYFDGLPLKAYTNYPASSLSMTVPIIDRTNILLYSEQIDNAVWTKEGSITVSANSSISPDGRTTADLVTSGYNESVSQTISVDSGNTYTVSVYVKAPEFTLTVATLDLQFSDTSNGSIAYIDSNTQSGNVISTSNVLSSGTISSGDGWYRMWMTYIPTSNTITLNTKSLTLGVSEYNVWGFQVEKSNVLTSYIPTTANSVTYGPDIWQVVKSNNTIVFDNLAGANIANIVFANNTIVEAQPTNGPYISSVVDSVDYTTNTAILKTNTWLFFANVATVSGNVGSNVINIKTVTNSYNIINNGVYSNPLYPVTDIVFVGDTVVIANNSQRTVNHVDYINNMIYLDSNLTSNVSSYLSVRRTLNTTNVNIWGPVGTIYYPELTTEDGRNLVTEDDRIIILG
jgi:hypothetical protein